MEMKCFVGNCGKKRFGLWVLPTGRVEENDDHSEARQGRDRDGCIGACPGHHPGEEAAGDAEGGGDVGAGGDHRGGRRYRSWCLISLELVWTLESECNGSVR